MASSISRTIYEVSICKFADFGEPSESFTDVDVLKVDCDDLTIDGSVPEFSITMLNPRGKAKRAWKEADIVKIKENKKVVFLGSINDANTNKNNSSQVTFSGIHYYWRVLMDTYMTTASQLTDTRFNIWRWGRRSNAADEMLDGLNPSLMLKALTGNGMLVQEFFDNMDNIDNVDWSRKPSEYIEKDTAETGLDNPSFESGLTGWSGVETDDDGSGGILYSNSNPVYSGPFALTTAGAKDGADVARFIVASGQTANRNTGTLLYQDNVTLEPGDIISAYVKVADGVGNPQQDEARRHNARVLLFENNSFDHARTGETGKALVVGTRVAAFESTWEPVGGSVDIQTAGTFRVAIHIHGPGSEQETSTSVDLWVDHVQVRRNSGFTGVALYDGELQLQQLDSTESSPKYVTQGVAETNDYYVGNPNVRVLPFFNGTAKLNVLGTDDDSANAPGITLIYKRDNHTDFTIVGVDSLAETFDVSGDETDYFHSNAQFEVFGSTNNDGEYTVASSVYNVGPDTTTVTVNENITDATLDGRILNLRQEVTPTLDTTEDREIYPITTADDSGGAAQDFVLVAGNFRKIFPIGSTIIIQNSTANDGEYSVANVEYLVGTEETKITLNQQLSDSTADGEVVFPHHFLFWKYSFDTSGLDTSYDRMRIRFDMVGDGVSTPTVDYFVLDADIENYTRQVKYVNGQPEYRASKTGLSANIANIEDYVFPTDLSVDPQDRFNTFALEFFNQPMLVGIEELLGNTVKRSELDDTVVDGLPSGISIDARDSNWNFQIDNNGVVTFKEHVGTYYGKRSLTPKRFSFADRNTNVLRVKESGQEIINNMIYQGQGIGGINTLVLNGSQNALVDTDSVNTYGMRIGHVNEKKSFDFSTAMSRAHALLREKSSPITEITVELLEGCDHDWGIGDIIHVRDIENEINDDYRVLEKSKMVSDGGLKIRIRLSTKTPTVQGFVNKVADKLRPLNNFNQGAGFTAKAGGVPRVVSRDIPYILEVDIPSDAQQSLLRVVLDVHSEPVFTTTTILTAGAHTHPLSIPGLEIDAGETTVSQAGARLEGDGTMAAELVNEAIKGKTSNNNVLNVVPINLGVSNPGNLSTNDGSPTTWTTNIARPGAFSNWSEVDLLVVEIGQWNDSATHHPWKVRLRGANSGTTTNYVTAATTSTSLQGDSISWGTAKIYVEGDKFSSSEDIQVQLVSLSGTWDDDFTVSGGAWSVHDHGTAAGANGGLVVTSPAIDDGSGSTALSNIFSTLRIGYDENDGGSGTSVWNDGSTIWREKHSHSIAGKTVTFDSENAVASGGEHDHNTAFNLTYNRNSSEQLLFPINVNGYLNSVNGISALDPNSNAGPITQLTSLGILETGDLPDDTGDSGRSQKLNVGFSVEGFDASHLFKDADGNWLVGKHFIIFKADGEDNQVNNDNLGYIVAAAQLERVSSFNSDLGSTT